MRAYSRNTKIATATIASGASLSGAVGTDVLDLVAVITPAAWTAADITFQALYGGTTYVDCYISTADTEVTVQAGASRFITIPAGTLSGANSIKVRSGTAGLPVNQAAARDVTLIFGTAV